MTEIQIPIDSIQADQNHRRDVITKLVSFGNFDDLREMGIEIIEEEGRPGESCYEAAFSLSSHPRDILSRVIRTWQTVDIPQPDDVVIYINKRSGAVTHVGRVIEGDKVRSRWGLGGILCEYPPLDVPIYCGKEIEVVYYRE